MWIWKFSSHCHSVLAEPSVVCGWAASLSTRSLLVRQSFMLPTHRLTESNYMHLLSISDMCIACVYIKWRQTDFCKYFLKSQHCSHLIDISFENLLRILWFDFTFNSIYATSKVFAVQGLDNFGFPSWRFPMKS